MQHEPSLEAWTAPELYKSYFDDLPCYVAVQDRDLRLVAANRLFKERFGNSLGARCWETCKQRVSHCPDCPVEKTFLTGEAQQAQEIVRSARGQDLPVMVYTSPLRHNGGEAPSHVLQVFADISELRRLQSRLHRAEQRSRHLFDEAPCYITVQDPELKLVAANRRFKDEFGDEPGLHCYEAYKHRDEPCLPCPVMRTFREGTAQSSEEVVTSIGGKMYNVLVNTAPLRNDEGDITHVIEMSTNITEMRELEGQLTSLGLLLSSISHGIKGLLTAIDGGMYLVNSGLPKNDQNRVREGWDIVQRNVRRVRSMMLDILYYSKNRDFDYETVDVLELAAEVAGCVAYRAEELDLDFQQDLATSLGQFQMDPNALRTALVNILENAFDACRLDRGKGDHSVGFRVTAEPDWVIFEIRDNGVGMDRETVERAFTLFFSSKGNEGTGLGLFISNKIIRQLGGSIDLESKLNVGTRFRVRLPRTPPQQGEAADSP